jgi:redox-sensitive bicupin YhaK (pirin superfamily)
MQSRANTSFGLRSEALETRDGAGVKLRRAFGDPLIAYETDPFLLLDDFGSRYPH